MVTTTGIDPDCKPVPRHPSIISPQPGYSNLSVHEGRGYASLHACDENSAPARLGGHTYGRFAHGPDAQGPTSLTAALVDSGAGRGGRWCGRCPDRLPSLAFAVFRGSSPKGPVIAHDMRGCWKGCSRERGSGARPRAGSPVAHSPPAVRTGRSRQPLRPGSAHTHRSPTLR